MTYPKVCTGCGVDFDTDDYRRQKCRKDCGRTSAESHEARRIATENKLMDFVAVDGEGIDTYEPVLVWEEDEDGFLQEVVVRKKVHRYVLFSVGNQSLHRGGAVLTHREIFQFLWDCYQECPDAAYVGFFLGYDFAQWLRSLPDTKAWRLLHSKGIASRQHSNPEIPFPWPVRCDGWEFDILGTKRFKIRPDVPWSQRPVKIVHHRDGTLSEKRVHPHKWMYINDAGPFFQTSLMKAIDPKDWQEPIVTDTEYEILKRGKDNRDQAVFDEEMIRYNVLENDVLPRLMRQIDIGLRSDGIRLGRHKWFGPGQAAQAWLGLVDAPTGNDIREVVPAWARDAARHSYYGGWFEIFAHGPVSGTTYAHDINSAYPHIIRSLPCLLHGVWTKGKGKPADLPPGHLRLINASVIGKDELIGAMPHRRPDGTILRPHRTSGWYWQDEVDAAQRAGLISRLRVIEWVEYTPCACPPPLRSIEDLYQGRLAVGKNSAFGKAKKLVYNSAYGKMAQSIGQPKYSNSIYASRITSGCRTMILDAIATHPQKSAAVVMVATDSVVFTSPHPSLPLHETELGAWDQTEHQNLSLMMPGLYWDDSSRETIRAGQSPKVKSRGVPARDLAAIIDDIDQQWADLAERATRGMRSERVLDPETAVWPTKDIHLKFAMVSAKLAAAQNRWGDCGRVMHDAVRTISANPRNKRAHFVYNRSESPGHTILRSYPYPDIPGEPRSSPYGKGFGEDAVTMTDWRAREAAEYLTPDGYAVDAIRGVIPG